MITHIGNSELHVGDRVKVAKVTQFHSLEHRGHLPMPARVVMIGVIEEIHYRSGDSTLVLLDSGHWFDAEHDEMLEHVSNYIPGA